MPPFVDGSSLGQALAAGIDTDCDQLLGLLLAQLLHTPQPFTDDRSTLALEARAEVSRPAMKQGQTVASATTAVKGDERPRGRTESLRRFKKCLSRRHVVICRGLLSAPLIPVCLNRRRGIGIQRQHGNLELLHLVDDGLELVGHQRLLYPVRYSNRQGPAYVDRGQQCSQ